MVTARLKLLFFGLFIGAISSCVQDPKDIPSGIADSPVFGLQGTFGGETLSIEAGRDSWTMLPVVGMEDSLTLYKAVFSKDGCLDQCTPSWTFLVYQPFVPGNDPAEAFSALIQEGEKEFIPSDIERKHYEVSLTTHPGLFMSGFTYWENIHDSSTTYFHEYQSQLGYQEHLYVCLQSLAFTGCQYSQCLYFDPATEIPCVAYIEPILENPRFLSLNVKPSGTPPFTFQWSNESTASGIVIPLQDSVATVYAAVTVIDGRGNRSEINQTIKVNNGFVDACYFPVSLISAIGEDQSPSLFAGRVEIIYQDEEGQTWRSAAGTQPETPVWEIHSRQAFGMAPTIAQAYLIEAQTHVTLFNETTGESRRLDTERLSLAFGHH